MDFVRALLHHYRRRLDDFENEGDKRDEDCGEDRNWGDEKSGRLLLSMGMPSDFEAALKSGSDIVRVGTGIFGQRAKKM